MQKAPVNDHVEIPAYAADTLHESMTVFAPVEWHDRIRALAPCCCYGPGFRRGVLDSLKDVTHLCRNGYLDLALHNLESAENIARRAGVIA